MAPPSLFPAAAFLQFTVQNGDPDTNLARVCSLVGQLQPGPPTLVVLPELWGSGFDYPRIRELAAATPDLLAALTRLAGERNLFFAGSLVEEDGGLLYNTLFLSGPAGIIGRYRKQHLFAYWQEDRFFHAGDRPAPMATEQGSMAALVCYDLRFPELARQQIFQGARLLVVSAQWPQVRLEHWQILLRARAIENQVFVVAANGCGQSGEVVMAGHSAIIGADGVMLAEAGEEEELRAVALDPLAVTDLRGRFCSVAQRPYLRCDADKVVALPDLLARLAALRSQGSRVAFTNGCFDILHAGHVDYLEQARKTADCLVLGLNSDASVARLKGASRPVNPQGQRARVLAALACVDFVVIFEEDTPLQLISALLPDVLVKGADWPEDQIAGAAEVKAAGGRVERIVFAHQTSTSALIETIRGQQAAQGR